MRIPIYRGIISLTMILALVGIISSCSIDGFDEGPEILEVKVQLVYPENSVDPYEGVRVQLKDASSSVFVDSTDSQGAAHFRVVAGVYEASTSDTHTTYDYRYFFNGVKSQIVVSADSSNVVNMNLKMSKKRIVH